MRDILFTFVSGCLMHLIRPRRIPHCFTPIPTHGSVFPSPVLLAYRQGSVRQAETHGSLSTGRVLLNPGKELEAAGKRAPGRKSRGEYVGYILFFYFSPYDMILLPSVTPASENEPCWSGRWVEISAVGEAVEEVKRGSDFEQAGRGQGEGLYKFGSL